MPLTPLFTGTDISLAFNTGDEMVTAVEPCSIMIPQGEITIIFGPSGSGKSSLLNMLSGLQKPTTGTLTYEDRDVYDQTTNELAYFRARQLGIVYQTNYWVKSLSVIENICLPLYFLGVTRKHAHASAMDALRRIDMMEYAPKSPLVLSGGEQQRVAMARAIVSNSPVMIADEPTGNLDSSNGDHIMNLLVELQRDYHKTVILVTHNMEYLAMAKHLLHIQDGHIDQIDGDRISTTVRELLNGVEERMAKLSRIKSS